MNALVVEGGKALARMPLADQRLIRNDWHEVLKTARSLKEKDGLVDQARPHALKLHGIDKRSTAEYNAYNRFLTEYFLFGEESLAEYARRRQEQMGGRSAHR